MTYSSLAARFVAAPDVWSRGTVPIRAIAIHMAEGGGTVSWLTRDDGNSSHYVVEYDGDIVAMVHEEKAAGSINPRALRTTDDPSFTYLGSPCRYGDTAGKSLLGSHWTNPNAAVIAIEVEGFAATGPNTKQRESLAKLVKDIRRRRGALGTLGHRDFQSYKACPGKRVPWVDYGGHAIKTLTTTIPTGEVTTVAAIKGSNVPEAPTRILLKTDPANAAKSRWLYVYSDHRPDAGNIQLQPNRKLYLTRFIDADTYAVAYEPAAGDTNDTSREMFVKTGDIAKTELVPLAGPDVTPISQAAYDEVKAELANTTARLTTANTRITRAATDLGATPGPGI